MRNTIFSLVVLGTTLWLPADGQVTVAVTPSQADVHLGTFLQFAAKVSGTSNTSVAWTVALAGTDNIKGSPGNISNAGRYTPPGAIPNPSVVFVTATSNANPAVSATAAISIVNPYPTVASVSP